MSDKTYAHQLDAKNRMRIPAKLRDELGDNYYVTVGTGGCLCVYTEAQMQKVNAFLSDINPFDNAKLQVARYIIHSTWHAEEDAQGRILLPQNLRQAAKIDKNILVFKGPNCIEIWGKEVWESYVSNVDFGSLADLYTSSKENA